MFGYLVLLFTVLPALELYVLIKVGASLGAANTIAIIVFTGVAGAALARYQGFSLLAKIQKQLNSGILPSQELLDGVMILVGGVLLLTPGFITDTLGLLLLIPLTRGIFKIFIRNKMAALIREGAIVSRFESKGPSQGYDDIDIN